MKLDAERLYRRFFRQTMEEQPETDIKLLALFEIFAEAIALESEDALAAEPNPRAGTVHDPRQALSYCEKCSGPLDYYGKCIRKCAP